MQRIRNKSILFLFCLGLFYNDSHASSFVGKFNTSLIEEHLPETLDEAVDYLIKSFNDTEKAYLKNFPKCDLIIFHFGWGTGIRNGLGLWGKNNKLLESCAAKAGKTSIHPDDASFIIIEGVWAKLNKELDLTDFTTVEPDKYFDAVWKTLQKANQKNNVNYLASLPIWMYGVRRLNFTPDSIKARNTQLLSEAQKLVNANNERSFLGLLYLVSYDFDRKKISLLLDKNLELNTTYIELPSYNYKNVLVKNLLIRPHVNNKIADKKVKYNWNNISLKDLAVKCYGSLNEKYFNSIEDLNKWKALINSNYLIKWKNEIEISERDYFTLSKNPRELLEILTLTKKYFYFEEHNHGLTEGPYRDSKKSIATLVSFLRLKDTLMDAYPYNDAIVMFDKSVDPRYQIYKYDPNDSSITKSGRSIVEERQLFSFRATCALKVIADKLSTEEVFDMLNSNTIIEYNKKFKTEDLSDYKILGGFLLATQYKRILNYPNKDKVFETFYYYWKNEFITWPMQNYLIELLFQVDKKRALPIFLENFKSVPTEGSFTRNGILESIIKYDFADNKDFIEKWYWTVYDKGFNYHPYEPELILTTLKNTNTETMKLYNKILSDKRYKK